MTSYLLVWKPRALCLSSCLSHIDPSAARGKTTKQALNAGLNMDVLKAMLQRAQTGEQDADTMPSSPMVESRNALMEQLKRRTSPVRARLTSPLLTM